MERLNNAIDSFKEQLSELDKVLVSNDELTKSSKYPFNKYANIFSVLLTKGNLTYEQYIALRDSYFHRNPNLDKFEMAPRTFGQTWGEDWLKKEKEGILVDPPKKDGYTSQFDLWLPTETDEGIKIEVKSSHVAEDEPESILVEKAYKKPQGTDEEIKNKRSKIKWKL